VKVNVSIILIQCVEQQNSQGNKKSKEITYLKAHFAHGKLQPCESWAKTKSQGYTRETNGLHESWSNMTND
jgi:hypothetical protein